MNRKQFIRSAGATCDNWTWSWSFINEAERIIIFGEWDIYRDGRDALILSEDWQFGRSGKAAGYRQSREHIRLIEEEGYSLMTFSMEFSRRDDSDETSPARIEGFVPRLTAKRLTRRAKQWYATYDETTPYLPDEIDTKRVLLDGAVRTVSVNAYERNPAARRACLMHHGYSCMVCAFNFEERYGTIGREYIHVHHIVPVSEIGMEYVVDPVNDLVPVCPNCHAMLHTVRPCLTIGALRDHLVDHRRA